MSVLFYGFLLFASALLIHVIIWKIHLPTHQKTILLLLFGGTLAVGMILFAANGKLINFFGISVPRALSEFLQLFIFFSSLSLAYMVTYSALEADSPSLVMVMAIAMSKKEGLDEKTFNIKINDEVLLAPRLKDLVSEKLAYIEKGKYKLTAKGKTFARIFFLYRRLLKRPHKGG